MNDDALDKAIAAADRVLAGVDPDDSRLAIASAVTLAVLPEILFHVDAQIQDTELKIAEARGEVSQAHQQTNLVTRRALAQSAQMRMVFEEINPSAVAQQIIGRFTEAGHHLDDRDHVFVHSTVRQVISRMAKTLGFALSSDAEHILEL